jgi:hypothetical protein
MAYSAQLERHHRAAETINIMSDGVLQYWNWPSMARLAALGVVTRDSWATRGRGRSCRALRAATLRGYTGRGYAEQHQYSVAAQTLPHIVYQGVIHAAADHIVEDGGGRKPSAACRTAQAIALLVRTVARR